MPRSTPETLAISAILNNGDVYAAANYGVQPIHFKGHQETYQWLLDYYKKYGICPSIEELQSKFPDFSYSSSQYDARYPAFEVKRKYAERDLLKRTMESMRCLRQNDVEGAYKQLTGISLDLATVSLKDTLADETFLDDYDEPETGRVPVPWNSLMGYTYGIGPGELWYLAARQGQGKSSLLVDVISEALMSGRDVGMYSLEMTSRAVTTRVHADLGRRLGIKVNQKDMLHRRFDKLAYKELLGEIKANVPGKLHIHDTFDGSVSPSTVATNAAKYQLNVVDYVGLMRTDDGRAAVSDWRAMAEISNELKAITLSRNTAILGAVQVNREGDNAGQEPPRLKNLAQSDHLGNDGDVVMTMKRVGQSTAVISLEKNRNAESMVKWWVKYNPNQGDYGEITYEKAQEILAMEDD